MYARSTTFHGRPDNIDAGITFINSEAGPMLDKVEGCRGLSMLVDRETGHCIATSSWESEAAMRASDEQLRPLRDRGRDILGGSMQVDEWEIAVMHRTHHGECCRVSWLQGDLDAMTETCPGRHPSRARTDSWILQRQPAREPVHRPVLRHHRLGDVRGHGSQPPVGRQHA